MLCILTRGGVGELGQTFPIPWSATKLSNFAEHTAYVGNWSRRINDHTGQNLRTEPNLGIAASVRVAPLENHVERKGTEACSRNNPWA